MQYFKGDAQELQLYEAGRGPFDLVAADLASFYAGAHEVDDFLLMLFDAGRMPFSDRVPRDSFVAFLKQAIPYARFTGTFEAYLFILKSIFGESSTVFFEIPGPGLLNLQVNIEVGLEFDLVGRAFASGAFESFNLITSDLDQITLRGISGIDSDAELTALLAELFPVGISPTVELTFFHLSNFVAEDGSAIVDSVVDNLGNQIVFFELGA